MNKDLVKKEKFTDWMNAGFNGEYNQNNPELSRQMCKRLKMADGTTLSIQASWGHYCRPRENAPFPDYDFYHEFEVGYPSVVIPEFMQYADDDDEPTETVYGYIPKSIIQSAIDRMGGVIGFDE